MRPSLATSLLALLLLVVLAAQFWALALYFNDRIALQRVLDANVSPALLPGEQAVAMLRLLRPTPTDANPSYVLLPAFARLGPTARQILEGGGDGADRSRLLVVLLAIRGIPAQMWVLQSREAARHAVVEVQTGRGPMAIDPLYGLWFPREGGGYYGVADLQRDPAILRRRVQQGIAAGERHGAKPLDAYPLDLYTYAQPRAAWSGSQYPALIIAALALVVEAGLVLAWLALRRRARRGEPPPA